MLGEQQEVPARSLAALGDWMQINNVRLMAVDMPLLLVTVAAALVSGNWA